MMTGYSMGFGAWGFLFMGLFWIVIIAGSIWLLSNLFPKNNRSQAPQADNATAIEILKLRYARGELTNEEYESIRYDLEN